MIWARVKDGEVIDYVEEAPNVDQSQLAPGKPRILVVEEERDPFDPITQIQEGPTLEFEEDRIVQRFTSRAKNEDEVAAMRRAKDAAIDREFNRLYNLPILHTVGGVEYEFHADNQARENIQGVLLAYANAPLIEMTPPDPRPWTPKDSAGSVMISRAELAGLGIAIALRKDALFVVKKTKQAALAALTDPAEINAVDPLDGWDIA